ncbi:NAD(P)/FAD-dependent oxidoreductase [Herbaspirillum robiniae]|uniref:NADH:ubiquinone reductase (non-electrogenic) n=1 Tax=Herbaspirillum robiniae TaxID=2014887 RepID=A0A2D0B5B8_9BURK|nr:NAD(P)/FAD-dependent oxidoreductase [Herbaspirillum robiniae]NUU03700.1 NAD(P)/FAD-dependent oxidoreductase [Herbaspirillum robiniae]OWY29584.1 FAD-dependent oxidoreductase [Herbaspirillum robiniae]
MPHVVIIGCGFGGLAAARELAGADVRITMIDRSNHHLFQPLLYQVATAGLSAPAISAPIRAILSEQRNLTTLMAAVTAIDVVARTVTLEDGASIAYDHLIVAAGSTHSYFGRDEWAQLAPGLKTLEDAFEIRKRILMAFEYAERETDARRRQEWLTFTVIGGGATGVEMAGTLVEIARHTLSGEFRNIDPHSARVVLIEGSDRILGAYPPDLSEKARDQLQKLGVDVRTGSRVVHIDEKCVRYANFDGEQTLASRTVIWSAGVAASPLGKSLGVELDRAGRVPVSAELNIAGRDDVYVIGDLAAAQSDGKPVPGVSPAAKQMGRVAARNIKHRIAGKPTEAFAYQDYGSLATIGRKAAIAMVGKLKFSGYPAWLFWLFVHVYFLIGFRNRIMVMSDWAWAYLTFKRSARVISSTMRERAEEGHKLPLE